MNDIKSFLVNKFNILNNFYNCDYLMTSNFAHQTWNFITGQTLACISHVSLFFYLFLFKHKEVFYTIITKCSYILDHVTLKSWLTWKAFSCCPWQTTTCGAIFFSFWLVLIGDEKWVWRNFENLIFKKIPVLNIDQNQIIDFKIF